MSKAKDRTQARGEFPRLNLSSETRAAFNELLIEAPKLGLDPERVEAAGLPGLRALLALKQAAESGTAKKRDTHLAQLQGTLRLLQYRKHPELVQQLQARAMALQGRGGDTEVAHVTVGEIVLPKALQTRAVVEALGRAAGEAGIPLSHLRVGSGGNSVNPQTGLPEFADPTQEPMEEITVTAPRLRTTTNESHVNAFFDTHRDRIAGLADEMGVPPDFLMGLSANESDWGRPKLPNNLFGLSDAKENPFAYSTPDDAINAFRKSQWYSRLSGKTKEEDFLNELVSTQNGKLMYNPHEGYRSRIRDAIDTVNLRLPIWEQKR